jgi:hypothetical protein
MSEPMSPAEMEAHGMSMRLPVARGDVAYAPGYGPAMAIFNPHAHTIPTPELPKEDE